MFDLLDELHEDGDVEKSFVEVKKLYDSNSNNQVNVELLWRYARACHAFSSISNDDAEKKRILQEGQTYAQKAHKIDEKHFNAVKFAAILTGSLTDYLSTKDRISQGYVFKGYLDKGLEMKPQEKTLLHMRGRFSYSVANLSWLERKAAATFFATPPTATFDEAIADFLEVEKIVNGSWIENLLFLAKSYLGKGEKKNALKYLEILLKLESTDKSEKKAQEEAQALFVKNSK